MKFKNKDQLRDNRKMNNEYKEAFLDYMLTNNQESRARFESAGSVFMKNLGSVADNTI